MNAWVQLTVEVPVEQLDVIAGDLWAAGVGGIEERAAGGPSQVTVVVGLDAAVLPAVRAVLEGHQLDPVVERVAADEGLDGWRDFAVPHVVGRIALVPAWWEGPILDGDHERTDLIEVRLDAARSFGHGGHVTTRLALELLQGIDLVGSSVIDVGCGSGVLAIAAVHLGARHVVAVDVSRDAVDAARANATRNDVSAAVEVRLGSLEVTGAAAADVVVANIEAPVLEQLAPQIVRLLRPDDRVVLSGFLTSQADRVRAAYGALDVERRLDEGEWTAFGLVRAR